MSPPQSPSTGVTTQHDAITASSPIPIATTISSKRKKRSDVNDPVEEFLLQELKGKGNAEAAKDAEDLFCESIAPTLRRLSLQKRQLAKLKIQQLLFDIEFND